ncbi:GCN5 family N-acetyltransferase [Azorhizobium oxalatiphilum]|uniref:GCN5 family N-acetyltransferase n=1 Tax=Azorhizobium oxalatiphilum TaxID=980631 RepID=A0A917FG98_9HYPH|nr:bifunctional acetate--CoA ligase family protein/GNAT family N-acetyltransferase [Azorhizobium oxalatiphilum]GGF79526.1 GCN5 family N-acetyltransferase [Azorhizobium oxalatiphilum]
MTTRNLDALFHPSAIALVGAGNRPGSIGTVVARNLFEAGFDGPILSVNPKERAVRSSLNYAAVADLPIPVDLAVLTGAPQDLPATIHALGEKGCRAAIVLSGGFGLEDGPEAAVLRQKMLDAARPHLLRIIGPNCLGFISTSAHINASYAHLMPRKGDVAFLSQSAALASAVLDWADGRGVGFSYVASLGDKADVDFGDMLDHLALDAGTRAIVLYLEHITDARKFMSAGRIAARAKPVIVIKAGRSAAGASAALSHTGALAGTDMVYDAAFRRAGMLRVYELRELFEAVTTLSSGIRLAGGRLSVLTNSGGAAVLATDALDEQPGELAQLTAETLGALDRQMPQRWSRSNPVRIPPDAPSKRYGDALTALLEDPGSDATLVLNSPNAMVDGAETAEAVIEVLSHRPRAPVLTCWLGDRGAADARRRFAAHRIPTYDTPDEAVRAFGHLVSYQRNQTLLMETPPARTFDEPDRDKARQLVDAVIASGRSVLTEVEAKAVLAAYDIPVVETKTAATPAEAALLAADFAAPVALKILSPDIIHKSDVGGVRLDLRTPGQVEEAAEAMLAMVQARLPDARIEGFTVQRMVRRQRAVELVAGIANDETFGPVVLFGEGGTAVDVIADRAVALPPLNGRLARDMIARTRISRRLAGYRDNPPADLDAIATTLVKVAELLGDLPQIGEMDINPLLADADGVIALDARIVAHPARETGTKRFAIKPYPTALVRPLELGDGQMLLLRPIRPEDEPALGDMVRRSDPRDVRMRFLGSLKDFPHLMAARLSQIDYDREMAFVALTPDGEMLGVVRIIADPDNEEAEYAIMVRSDMKGRGLGFRLMTEILDYGRSRGLKRIFGDVLRENLPMLHLAQDLGFTVRPGSDDPTLARVDLDLAEAEAVRRRKAGRA